jgi:hypothetical protein
MKITPHPDSPIVARIRAERMHTGRYNETNSPLPKGEGCWLGLVLAPMPQLLSPSSLSRGGEEGGVWADIFRADFRITARMTI